MNLEAISAAGPPRANILGVGISAIDPAAALALVSAAVRNRRKGYVCVTGVHGVTEAQSDPDFRRILNAAFLCTPDGMPMVWLGRLQGFRAIDRVYGPDLMLDVCRWSVDSGATHFLFGGAEGVAGLLAERLRHRFPGIRIVGTFTPPFRPLSGAEADELSSAVARARPDLFWVGLSTPKQERFMSEFLPRLETIVMFGVGAAFDFHTGRVRQAPRFVQRSGFEWLFRVLMEPRRLAGRYLRNNTLFVGRSFLQLTGLRRYRIDDPAGGISKP